MRQIILLSSLFVLFAKISHAQVGQLDTSFAGTGIVKTDFGFIRDNNHYATTGRQVWSQPDGKLNVLIEASGQSYIAKRFPNGSPDISYGNNGFSGPINIQQAVAAVQPDGKIVVAGMDFSYSFAVARYNVDGTPDNTFNGTGKQTTDFGSGYNVANTIAIENDGKIVVAGYAYVEGSSDFALARYNSDGSVDSSFSTDGKQTTDFGSETNLAYSVAIQADSKIVLVGQTYTDGVSDFALARYNSDGTLDTTFSNDGKQTADFNSSDDIGRAVAIQSDGKIAVAGNVFRCNNDESCYSQFALLRFNTNGTIDNALNGSGIHVTAFSSGYYATSLAIQPDGKIVVGGYADQPDGVDFALARFNVNGIFDNTFDDDGWLITDFGTARDVANSVTIQGDGKIVVAGEDYSARFDLARYNTDGRLDRTFSRGGKLFDVLHVYQGNTCFTSTIVQPGGKILAAGYTWNGSNYDFALARYNIDGSLDNNFSGDGRQTTDFDSADEYAYAVAIQNDGKIVLVGVTGSYFALCRYNTDGSPDLSFGSEGKKVTSFGVGHFGAANSVVICANGKILLAGYTTGPWENSTDFALARYNPDGSLDSTFSVDGKVTSDLGYDDIANAVAIQDDGKIVLAGYSSISTRGESSSFFAITRYNPDGTPDDSFSGDGKQFAIFSEFSNAQSVAIQNDGKIVAAGFSSSSSAIREDFALARFNIDGSPDNSFSEDGMQVSDFGSGSEYANSVAIQSDGKIVAAGSSNGNCAVARYFANGDLDSSFNEGGITVTEASGQDDVIYDVAVVNNKLYVAGSGQFPGNLGIVARYLLDDKNKAPVVSIKIPANIVMYNSPAAIKINATAADEDGTIHKVQFYNGKTFLHTEDVFPYGFLWNNVPAGSYTFTAKAFDNIGNAATSNSISVLVVDSNVAPVVNLVSPVNDTTYTEPATIRLIAEAKDPNDRIKKVDFFNGITLLRTEMNYPYTYSWVNVPKGIYSITAVATDDKGLSATSAPVTIFVNASNGIRSNKVSIKSVADANTLVSIKVSPNPADKTLYLHISGLQAGKEATILVVSASGVVMKMIPTKRSNQSVQLNIASLKSGIYTIKVIIGERVLYKQFVKL